MVPAPPWGAEEVTCFQESEGKPLKLFKQEGDARCLKACFGFWV